MFNNINQILNRNHIYEAIKTDLNYFEINKKNNLITRGIYVYGAPGVGKTEFIVKLLTDLNYNIIKYEV